MAGFFQDIVMEKAMSDRISQFARVDTPEVATHVQVSLNDSNAVAPMVESEETSFDDDIEAIRARRLAELRKASATEGKLKGLGHGQYSEIVESEFLNAVIKSPRAVVHFYHNDFARCKAVDKNLALVAPFLVGIRFLKINAEKCPFFVEKLNVRVLPSLVYFVDGKTVSTVTGFAEYGGTDDFEIANFLNHLKDYEMLKDSDERQYSKWLAPKAAAEKKGKREALSDSD